MGKDISRTYVDGKLIFGNDPMAALQNLLANDVLKIRVYDENADDNPHRKRRKGEEMRRVFNIETKSKLIQATTGHFLASYGKEAEKTTTAMGSALRPISFRKICCCRPMPFSIISIGNRTK